MTEKEIMGYIEKRIKELESEMEFSTLNKIEVMETIAKLNELFKIKNWRNKYIK